MKNWRQLTIALAALAASAAAAAPVPIRWTVETSRVAPAAIDAYHGETLRLEATLQSYGKPLATAGETPCIYWQTNGMGTAYWSAPATCSNNVLRADFTPEMDPGSAVVHGFIGLPGEIYRASFTLRFRTSPGATPNVLPLPTPTLDFAAVEVLNPPWTGEIPTAVSNVVTKSYVEAIGISADFSTNNQELVETIEASGKVKSVNEKTGDVVLDAGDVSAVSLAFVAPPFTRGVDYAVGDFVEINGVFYRFNSRWRGSWQSDPIEDECVDELTDFAKVGEAMLDQTFLPLGFGGTNAPAYKKIFTGRSNGGNGYFLLFPDGFSVENTFGGELRVINDELHYYSDGVLKYSMRLADIVTYMAFSPVAQQVATNNAAIASHTSQLSQLSQSLDGKLDKDGDYSNVSNKAVSAVQPGDLGDLAYLDSIDGLETDPTVSSWAKAATKPTYTASEVGAATTEEVYRLITGTNVVLVITNYNSAVHAPAMKLQHLDPDTNEYVTYWDETRRHGLTLTNAMDYADAAASAEVTRADAAYAPRAWSRTTSGLGADAPDGVTWISTPETVIAGGYEYEKVVTSAGAVWILTSNGLATGANTNSFFRVAATDGTELFSIEKTDSNLVGVNADGITRSGNTVTIPVNVVAPSHPYIRATTNLVNAVWTKEDENGFSCPFASVSWSGSSGAYVATVACSEPQAFFYFEYLVEGVAKVKNTATTELVGGIYFGGYKYMPAANGNKLEFIRQ